MNTFTREEEKLVIVIAACFLMATAVLLCCPEYNEKVTLTAIEMDPKIKAEIPGAIPVTVNRPNTTTKALAKQVVDLSNKLDPNFATYEELIKIPGIGPSTAKTLLSYREKHILFSSGDLKRIKGIGPQKLAKLQKHFVFSAKIDGQ